MTTPAPTTLRHSPLDARHRALDATMTAFAGWEMPLDYGSVVAEHRAVRASCGMFDLSHLGTLAVTGPGAEAAVRRAFTNDVTALAVGRAHYSLCLDAAGGIVDDLLVYRLPWGLFVVPNAANAALLLAHLQACAAEVGATQVTDVNDSLACVAVQGPQAAQVAGAAGLGVLGMDYLDCRELVVGDGVAGSARGVPEVIARSGYTGEHGYEAFIAADRAGALWERLLAAGALPAGLGARDTLRLEMGYPLHGQDISLQTSPVEADLGWAVKGTGFFGEAAYRQARAAKPRRRLRGLRALARGVPRAHCAVSAGDQQIGETTSGTFSPSLRIGVALAYLDPSVALGAQVAVDVRGRALPAEVVTPPFVDSRPR